MGPKKTLSFFARKEKFRGTACFLLGVGLILAKYPLIGFCIELYGILNLFGDFFGIIIGFLGSVPVVSMWPWGIWVWKLLDRQDIDEVCFRSGPIWRDHYEGSPVGLLLIGYGRLVLILLQALHNSYLFKGRCYWLPLSPFGVLWTGWFSFRMIKAV